MEHARSAIRQKPERSVPEEAAAILQAGHVAHVGFVVEGQPYVIPFVYGFDGQKLFLHGSPTSRALNHLAGGAAVCVTVTLADGLIYSRTARFHSMNYRSVVCFGTARRIDSSELKSQALQAMIQRYFPGRTAGSDYEAPSEAHLRATLFLEVTVDEWSAKMRAGGPRGPLDDDGTAWGSSGVIDFGPRREKIEEG